MLVHVEVESLESVQAFRPCVFEYYVQLRRGSQLPVRPIRQVLIDLVKGRSLKDLLLED